MEHAVAVVIPALDEEASIAGVVESVLREVEGATVFVVDNRSRDQTKARATEAGAVVIAQPRRGYGWACRAGCDAAARTDADVIVFLDGDGSMPAESIPVLVGPIVAGAADVVCGARSGRHAPMPWHQRLGNRVIALQLRVLYGVRLRELGPFRAVRASTLAALALPGSRYSWPAQLLARAARQGARVAEVAVGYRDRTGGRSKVSGSLKGSLLAAWDISRTLLAERVR
ncbi:MAG: glycosyltransferase family 2 protein [Candidatus Dormibacteraeota bacterium]|nr:glycosyltransferase family 2 protein [Candidatus Dormibacteraeota bacterium]